MARTRIAPSPTGFPHIGTIYQALFNKAYALKTHGQFIWRLEDTDQKRFVKGSIEALKSAFNWFGLTPDESIFKGGKYGPYRQSERLDIYKKHVNDLVSSGHAYYCFCTTKRLEEVRALKIKQKEIPMYDGYCRELPTDVVDKRLKEKNPFVIRLKVPKDTTVVCNDLVRGEIKFDSNLVDDQIILKSDGFPTYHLAVVVDDHLMKITDILRGAEWITSFPKHKLLYEYFGWNMPNVIHTPLITDIDGSKLSKRHGHSSVSWYRKKGFLPDAILNFISLLGWSHPKQKEIFSFKEFVDVFDIKDLSSVNPKFDLQKLIWMNGQYIKNLSNELFIKKLISWLDFNINYKLEDLGTFESDWNNDDYVKFKLFIESLSEDKKLLFAEINKGRIKTFEDILEMNRFFINDLDLDMDLLSKYKEGEDLKAHLVWFKKLLSDVDEWALPRLKELEGLVKGRSAEINWKIMEVFYPIRIAICRNKVSPPLFESIYILGKEKALSRLDEAILS